MPLTATPTDLYVAPESSLRLAVRTSASHVENRGSIPLGSANKINDLRGYPSSILTVGTLVHSDSCAGFVRRHVSLDRLDPGSAPTCSEPPLGFVSLHVEARSIGLLVTRQGHDALLGDLGVTKFCHASVSAGIKRHVTS